MPSDLKLVDAIRLVSYQPQFFPEFLKWRFQKSTVAHNPLAMRSREELAADLDQTSSDLSEFAATRSFRWFITLDDVPVGHISLSNVNQSMRTAELGYTLGESYHGRGIATTAVAMVIEKAFDETPLRKLTAYVHEKNLPSLRLLNRLGFRQEGILRQHYLINAVGSNEVLFGLLREDWADRQSSKAHHEPTNLVKFVVLLQAIEGVTTRLEHVREHVNYLRKLDQAGKLVLSGPFHDQNGGMLILDARDLTEATEIAMEDPFVKENLRTYEVRQWNISCELNKHLGMG